MMGLKKAADKKKGSHPDLDRRSGRGDHACAGHAGRLTGASYAGIATPGYTLTYHRNGAVKTVMDGKKSR
jgi:hypothetical protein